MIEVKLRVPESVRDKVSEVIAEELGKVEREIEEVELQAEGGGRGMTCNEEEWVSQR